MPATPRGGKKTSADEAAGSNVKVMTRVRLFNSRELKASKDKGEELLPVVRMRPNGDVELHELYKVEGMTSSKVLETFSFDHAFWSMPSSQADCPGCPYATQEDVFNKSGAVATAASFDGYNSCIFAYGQTGSGKTYTMLGSAEDPGVCPRVVDDVFARMNAITADSTAALPMAKGGDDVDVSPLVVNKCELELTFYEISMEQVRDLFLPRGEYEKPRISQGPFGVTVNGLVRGKPKDCVEAKRWMVEAMNERTTAPTKMNPFSSRSHAVFQLHLTQVDGETGTRKRSTINLVDLAGSEKLNQSEAEGFTAKQAIMINKSLFVLRNVIDALVAKAKHVPIRESILTFSLSDALGGNSKTQMIAAISPHSLNLDDTKHTLQYAMKAKKMVTKPTVNQENSEMARMQQAKLIEELKRQLAEGATNNAVLPELSAVAEKHSAAPAEMQRQHEAALAAQSEKHITEVARLKSELEEARDAHTAAEEKHSAAQAEMQRQHEAALAEVTRLKGELEAAGKSRDERSAALSQQLETLAAATAKADAESADLKRELNEVKETHAAATAKADAESADLKRELDEAKETLAAATAKAKQAHADELAAAKSAHGAAVAEVQAKHDGELSAVAEKHSSAQAEMQRQHEAALPAQSKKHITEVARLKSELEEARDAHTALEDKHRADAAAAEQEHADELAEAIAKDMARLARMQAIRARNDKYQLMLNAVTASVPGKM